MKGGSPETGLARPDARSDAKKRLPPHAGQRTSSASTGMSEKLPTGAGFPLAKNTEWEAKAEAGRMTAIRAITYVDGAGARPGRM